MPTALLMLCNSIVKLCIDTGAEVNVLDEDTFKKLNIKPRLEKCRVKLYAYGTTTPIQTLGQFTTRVKSNNCYRKETFLVTSGCGGNLLSYQTAISIGVMLKINNVTVESDTESTKWKKMFPELFTGKVGLYKNFQVKLHIDESIT